MRSRLLLVQLTLLAGSLQACSTGVGTVSSSGPFGCTDGARPTIAVHLAQPPKTQVVQYGIYSGDATVFAPQDLTTVSLSNPDALDFTFPLQFGDLSICYPDLPGVKTTADSNGNGQLAQPVTLTLKVIRPADFTVLAQGTFVAQP